MSRHLLPKNKGVVNVITSGQWVDFSEVFNAFQSNIEIPKNAKINVTSIPSPWARMLLFKEAIMSSAHMLHLEVMSNILDVIEIIYFNKIMDFKLEVKDIILTDQNPTTNFHDVLYKLFPEDLSGQDVRISLLLATKGDDTFVLAGTSPFTLFFTPLELTTSRKIPRYFEADPVMLVNRPPEFQRWLKEIFIPKLIEKGTFTKLVDAFAHTNGIGAGSNPDHIDQNEYCSFDLFDNNDQVSRLLDCTKHCQITSSNLLKVQNSSIKAPFIFDTSLVMSDRPYYNSYTFTKNFTQRELKGMNRDILPGEIIRYPWLLPIDDFLEPCIIRFRYNFNKNIMITGKESNVFNYLLPLSSTFFEYFSIEDVASLISILNDGKNSVKVKLNIPLQDGQCKVIEKRYNDYWSENKKENCIIEYDDTDISTPLPHLVFWPKIHPEIWEEPYYCLQYGERYNKQEELISLAFKNKDNSIIPVSLSRKANGIEVVKLDKLPTYIAIKDNNRNATGYLILDHNRLLKPDFTTSTAKVGLDFGTSHTNIAFKLDNDTEILTYNSHYNGLNLNSEDFISTISFKDGQITTDNIPKLIKANLGQYLFPNILGKHISKDEANFPMPTMVVKEDDVPDPIPLLHYSINFSKSVLYSYKQDAKTIHKSISPMTNLKWNHDINSQNSSEAYLSILLLLLRCELIKRHVKPQSVKYIWAYPRSFSRVDIDKYDRMWGRMLNGLSVSKTDESKAALLYFDHTGIVSANNPGMVVIADIGGGSSDVSVWHDREIRILTSSLWAGRDLAGYRDTQGFCSILLKTLKSEFKDIAERYQGNDDHQTRLNYILYSLEDTTLEQYAISKPFYRVRFLIIYFFSSLFYEIGIQCSSFADKSIESLKICLAGNGSRFACWSGNKGSVSDLDADIYKAVLRASMGLGDDVSIDLQTSQAKKSEVAIGLCEGRDELFAKKAEFDPVIAESISIEDNKIPPNLIISEFDETYQEKAMDLDLSKNDSNLVKFHKVLFDILEKSDLYRRELKTDTALSDLQKVKTYLLGDWGNIVGDIRTLAGDNIEKLSSISSSLFILGMKVTIRRLHKFLMDDGQL